MCMAKAPVPVPEGIGCWMMVDAVAKGSKAIQVHREAVRSYVLEDYTNLAGLRLRRKCRQSWGATPLAHFGSMVQVGLHWPDNALKEFGAALVCPFDSAANGLGAVAAHLVAVLGSGQVREAPAEDGRFPVAYAADSKQVHADRGMR